jgi:hypothetical protein
MRENLDEGANELERPVEGEGIPPSPELEKPAPSAESRFARFTRTLLRWFAAFLIAFLLGALAVYWFLYRPQAEELAEVRSQAEGAQQRVAELEVYQSQNDALRAEQRETNVQVYILRALADVNAARLALATEDVDTARDALSNTGRDLTSLSNLVGSDQRAQLAAMQDRLTLAVNEMGRDAFAAQSDLGVLETNLRQLESELIEGD